MPSPIGHSLAGLALGRVLAPDTGSGSRRFLLLAVIAANAPDLDILAGAAAGRINAFHPSESHSLAAVAVVAAIAAVTLGRRWGLPGRVAAVAACAYASHIGLDYICGPPGRVLNLPLLWPLSDAQFISSWLPFEGFMHGPRGAGIAAFLAGVFSPKNTVVVFREVVRLGPFVATAWMLRRPAPRRDPAAAVEAQSRERPV